MRSGEDIYFEDSPYLEMMPVNITSYERGFKEGMLKGRLESSLELRFGKAGLAVMERFREIKDIAFLERMVAQVRTASLEEFERAIGE